VAQRGPSYRLEDIENFEKQCIRRMCSNETTDRIEALGLAPLHCELQKSGSSSSWCREPRRAHFSRYVSYHRAAD
jgi:hypothetical protein